MGDSLTLSPQTGSRTDNVPGHYVEDVCLKHPNLLNYMIEIELRLAALQVRARKTSVSFCQVTQPRNKSVREQF